MKIIRWQKKSKWNFARCDGALMYQKIKKIHASIEATLAARIIYELSTKAKAKEEKLLFF